MSNRVQDSAPNLDRLLTHHYTGPSPGRDPLGGRLPGEDREEKEWCSFRPFSSREQLTIVANGLFQITDARFVVRAGGLAPWRAMRLHPV